MKHLKIFLLIISISLFSFIIFWFIIKKYYLIDIVHTRIEKNIGEHIENDFQFTFDNFSINWISNTAEFSGFNLLWFNEKDTVGYIKGNLLISIEGWRNIIFDKQKLISTIALKETELYYAKDYPLIMKKYNNQEVEISSLSVTGKIHLANKHKEQTGQLTTNFDFDVAINYKSNNEFNIDHFINQITAFEASELHYYFPDGYYQLIIKKVAFTEFDDITLNHVIINPIDSKQIFASKKKVATDYISVAIDSIQLTDCDSQVDERIFIGQIQMYQPSFDVFKDKNYPEDQKYKAILVDLLRDLEIPVYVRNMNLNNMFIKYTELADQAVEPGDLFFNDANASISNITNVEDSLELSSNIHIEAEAKFYGVGILKTTISYKVFSNSGQYAINGSLGSMNITEVNAVLSELLPAEVTSGQLNNLYFNFAGSRDQSKGEMRFEYSDLSIKVLEIDHLNSIFTRKIASGVGNIAMRNSNPSGNGVFRIGEIKQDRNTSKSMFNYWWISLRSGFLSTVGVTPEKEKINYKTGEPATFVDKIGMGDK